MAIFAIGDLHLSLAAKKPMDIFRGWQDYVQRLETNWRRVVQPEDTVVLVGDTSWAMKLEDCEADFAFLQALPGKKLLLKGNHDYWWTTMAKMNTYLQNSGFTSLSFLHNSCVMAEGVALCGTRGWLYDIGEPHDEKVMLREAGRLEASLKAAGDTEKIAFVHYPPVYATATADNIVQVLHKYKVKQCFYGHLHGASIPYAKQGNLEGVDYKLISADALEFCPYKV